MTKEEATAYFETAQIVDRRNIRDFEKCFPGWKSSWNKTLEADTVAADALRAQRWIPVSEMLPTSDGKFLVTVKHKGKPHVEVCIFRKNATLGALWDRRWEIPGVIAWRQRPEPYMQKQEAQE